MLSQLSYAPVPVRRRVRKRLSASDLIMISYSKMFVKHFFPLPGMISRTARFSKIVKKMKHSYGRFCVIFFQVIFKAVRDTGKMLLKALCPDIVVCLPASMPAGFLSPVTRTYIDEGGCPMNLVYKVTDRPKFGQLIVFALQQLLAILAATIAVPSIVGNGMSQSAALFGAGVGTIVYLLFTKFKSPVFLGSSFAFLGSMFAAFAGAVSAEAGYAGLVIGAVFAGMVYVVIALIVKFAGVKWISKLMPPVVIGPTVAIIGLSLAGNAIGNSFGFGSPQAS